MGSSETILAGPLQPQGFGERSSHERAKKSGVGPARTQSDNRQFVQKSPSFISYGDFLLGELDKDKRFELQESVENQLSRM
jgi:hypothetical protein